jgi:hypothetical protein
VYFTLCTCAVVALSSTCVSRFFFFFFFFGHHAPVSRNMSRVPFFFLLFFFAASLFFHLTRPLFSALIFSFDALTGQLIDAFLIWGGFCFSRSVHYILGREVPFLLSEGRHKKMGIWTPILFNQFAFMSAPRNPFIWNVIQLIRQVGALSALTTHCTTLFTAV